MTTTSSESQALRHLAAAIRNNDHDEFCMQAQMAVAYFDTQTAAGLISRQLPLLLTTDEQIITLQRYMNGDGDHADLARDFLAELISVMTGMGLVPGAAFSSSAGDDGIPRLHMAAATALRVENTYPPHEWRMCRPYLVIQD